MATRILLAMTVCLAAAYAGPAQAPTQVSTRARILWEVPLYQQSTNYSCGAAALQSALGYYGIQMTEEDIMKGAHTTAKDGTEMEPMAALAISKGLKATIRLNMTVAELATIVGSGQLTIVTMQAWRDDPKPGVAVKPWADTWDSGHYLTVIGVDDKNVFFVDPSLHGRRGFIPIPEFEQRWHDVSSRLGRMQAPAIVFEGQPSPTVWEQIL